MPTRKYVISETIKDTSELRARYHSASTTRILMLPHRSQLQIGDAVSVQLTIQIPGVRLMLGGVVSRIASTSRIGGRGGRAFALELDEKGGDRLAPYLTNFSGKSPDTRRNIERRAPSGQRWSECRVPTGGTTRSARILDVAPKGLFLATGLDVSHGDTVLFRADRGSSWLGGRVCWQGEKDGQKGVGMELVFSRAVERHSWNEFVVQASSSAST